MDPWRDDDRRRKARQAIADARQAIQHGKARREQREANQDASQGAG